MRALTATILVAVATAASACGNATPTPSTPPTSTAATVPASDRGDAQQTIPTLPQGTAESQRQADEHNDDAIERANDQLLRAARAHDRERVARAERELDQLARTKSASGLPPPPGRYLQALADLTFKQGPLYVQQLLSSATGDHRAYVAVSKDHFCLAPLRTRSARANAVYQPLEQLMRDAGIADFQFIVTPTLTRTVPTTRQALAIGRNGRLHLTQRGRTC